MVSSTLPHRHRVGPAVLGQGAQVGPEREPGHRELGLGDVVVDRRKEVVDAGLTQGGQGFGDALVAPPAVGDERVDDRDDRRHQTAVSRGQCLHGGREVAHLGQAGEVLAEIPIGRADHHRRAVHDVVARSTTCRSPAGASTDDPRHAPACAPPPA